MELGDVHKTNSLHTGGKFRSFHTSCVSFMRVVLSYIALRRRKGNFFSAPSIFTCICRRVHMRGFAIDGFAVRVAELSSLACCSFHPGSKHPPPPIFYRRNKERVSPCTHVFERETNILALKWLKLVSFDTSFFLSRNVTYIS